MLRQHPNTKWYYTTLRHKCWNLIGLSNHKIYRQTHWLVKANMKPDRSRHLQLPQAYLLKRTHTKKFNFFRLNLDDRINYKKRIHKIHRHTVKPIIQCTKSVVTLKWMHLSIFELIFSFCFALYAHFFLSIGHFLSEIIFL